LMSRIESLSYKEISLVLSISEKTVENHLVKALGILRNIFKPKTPEKTYTALTEA
jgi:RNA polymerase sigma-70 factor, ECF subfamily